MHLCEFPKADASLMDEKLSADVEALLRLVTLGSAARNSVKIKVRQPLAELKVTGGEAERRAVGRCRRTDLRGVECQARNMARLRVIAIADCRGQGKSEVSRSQSRAKIAGGEGGG